MVWEVLKSITSKVQKIALNVLSPDDFPLNYKIDVSIWSRLDVTLLTMVREFDETGKELELIFFLQGPLASEVCRVIKLLLKGCEAEGIIGFNYE